jgi:ABC-2 type transport system permease protein
MLMLVSMPTTLNYLAGTLSTPMLGVVESLSFQTHYDSILKGVIEFKDIAYFLILIVGWTSACSVILNERKAS